MTEDEKNIQDIFSSSLLQAMQGIKTEQRQEVKSFENYEQNTKEQKQQFYDIISQCDLFKEYFPDVKSIDDIKDDSLIFNCCCCFVGIIPILDNLKKDKIHVLNCLLQAVHEKKDFSFKIDDNISIFFKMPANNDVANFTLLSEYHQEIILSAIDIYLSSKIEFTDYTAILKRLSAIQDICYLKQNINNTQIKLSWERFDTRYINAMPLAINLYGIMVLLYFDEIQKKTLF